ncbi:VOC family protein [Streptomyces sp. NPDC004111]|uniref:VOC family protein n=1 Tax=Streptomyces sp. NPDC004111 TaxID=3364690 RepID=UPI0036A4D9F0
MIPIRGTFQEHELHSESPEFDHLLHCVPDVESATEAYSAAGLPAHANPPYLGFRNGAWRLDARYVEILSVVDRTEFNDSPFGQAMTAWMPHVDALLAAGGGALNFAVHVTDVNTTADRLRQAGHTVDLHVFAREGSPVSFTEAVLQDAPAWAPFFITYTPDRQVILDRYSAGRVARGPHDLAGFVIETPDPAAASVWLGELLGIPADRARNVVPLPDAEVHFTPGPADAITTLLLAEGTPPSTSIAGLDLRPLDTVPPQD